MYALSECFSKRIYCEDRTNNFQSVEKHELEIDAYIIVKEKQIVNEIRNIKE